MTPTFSHTRRDSPATPCVICRIAMEREAGKEPSGFIVNKLGTIVWNTTPVIAHVAAAGLLPFLVEGYTNEENRLEARTDWPAKVVAHLKAHPKFKSGRWWKLHRGVGDDLIEFRSFKGELVPTMKKSLQFIVDRTSGIVYADLDRHNPYEDLVGLVGHLRDVIKGEKKEPRA